MAATGSIFVEAGREAISTCVACALEGGEPDDGRAAEGVSEGEAMARWPVRADGRAAPSEGEIAMYAKARVVPGPSERMGIKRAVGEQPSWTANQAMLMPGHWDWLA